MINKDINYYMSLPYEVVVWQEPDDTAWFARIPDLPGVMTPARSKGIHFDKTIRTKVGLDQEFISKLSDFRDEFKVTNRKSW